jgi:DNA polymerase-3 subunit beta
MFSWDLEITELEPFRFIIPVRTVQEILRLPEDEPGDISVSMSENNVIFSRHDFLLLSRLIEGQYPNYQQVIPVNFNTTMNMNTKLLVNSLERAKTMPIDDKNKIPNVHFTLKGNEVLLHTYSEIMGEIIEIIEDMIIEGDPELQIAFNTNLFSGYSQDPGPGM